MESKELLQGVTMAPMSEIRPKTRSRRNPSVVEIAFAMVLFVFTPASPCRSASYTLSITASHGSVAVTPSKALYEEGETVELIPRPDTGYCFTSWSGDAQQKRLVLNLTMDRNKAITANFGTWNPPIGIPRPDFGIEETYRMYDDPANRNPALPYTHNAEGGYYTHYIDNTDPSATDTDNPYGTIEKPRMTIPWRGINVTALAAGSVVELHGGPYSNVSGTSGRFIIGAGTSEQPIFLRGFSESERITVIGSFFPQGSYMILENLYFDNVPLTYRIGTSSSGFYGPVDHMAVRNSDLQGSGTFSSRSAIQIYSSETEIPRHIVIYNNHIHHNGDCQAATANDAMGVGVLQSQHVWIVDNHIHHNGGDSVQIQSTLAKYIYIGRNVLHEDRENAVDIKQSEHVIVSDNDMYGYRVVSTSNGDAVVVHYTPTLNIWITHNRIYDSYHAISSGAGPDFLYITDNVIHNIGDCAIQFWNNKSVYIVGNTIYDTGGGISATQTNTALYMSNNIIANLKADDDIHLEIASTMADASNASYNLFYQSGTDAKIKWKSSTSRNVAEFKAAFPAKSVGCLEEDPQCVDASARRFNVRGTSPAIDNGTLDGVYQTFVGLYGIGISADVEGNSRPQGNGWDCGGYEYVLSAVNDLAVSGVSRNAVTCRWTVPGEEGVTGTPNLYDIRYAGSSITEGNWDTATQVQGEPVPSGFGTQQSFTMTGLDAGVTYYLAMKVGDEVGHFSQLSNVVPGTTATSGNHAPVLTPIGDRSVAESATLTFGIGATDADGDALTYSATGLPTGAGFTAGTRTFTWTPTSSQRGTYRVTFQVTDGQVPVSETITITVSDTANHAPVLGAIGGKSVSENAPLSFSVSATDEDGDSLTFSATGRPSGATFVSGAFAWTPNYSQAGSYQVTFTVSDGELTDSEQITITVANVTDQTAPVADEVFPPPDDAFQVPVNPVITFALSDIGLGIDPNTVALRVSDQLVYTGNSILYNSPDGICRRTGNPINYRYYFFPNDPFDFDQPVSVLVNASDLAHNAMTPLSYQFVTEMRSFGQNQLVSSNSGSSGHPAIATDSGGNIWAAWHTGQAGSGDIYVAKRGSETQQWAAPLRLTNLDSDQRNPAMAIGSNDTLYVTWQDNRRGNWDIYVSVSLDGVTWNDPVRLTDPNTNETNPAIAIDRASPNHVYIAWQQDEGAGNQDIYVASSSTRFISKAVTQVTSHAASQTEPALAVGSDNTVYLIWTDRRNGSADIYGSSSSAVSWANVAIATGAGNQSNPAIAVKPDSSSLHVLWVSDTTGNLDIVGGVSNGLPAAPISGSVVVDDTTGADQSAPAVLAVKDHWNRGHIYACWQDNRSVADSGDSDLYFAEIRSGAAGTNILVGDDGANSNQNDPVLGFDRYGEPVVLWVDDRGNSAQIYGACSTYVDPVSLVSGTVPSSTGGRVGPDPALIGDGSDVSIGIPSNALGCDALLAISEMQNAQKFGAPCLAGCEISPSGIQFSPPATVVIPYMASGSGPATPYWYDAQTGMLSQLGITDITRATLPNGLSVVSFNTTHLTPFYVLEGPSGGCAGSGSSSGGGCALSRAHEGSIVAYVFPYGALALFLFVRRWMDGRRKGDSERAGSSSAR